MPSMEESQLYLGQILRPNGPGRSMPEFAVKSVILNQTAIEENMSFAGTWKELILPAEGFGFASTHHQTSSSYPVAKRA